MHISTHFTRQRLSISFAFVAAVHSSYFSGKMNENVYFILHILLILFCIHFAVQLKKAFTDFTCLSPKNIT